MSSDFAEVVEHRVNQRWSYVIGLAVVLTIAGISTA